MNVFDPTDDEVEAAFDLFHRHDDGVDALTPQSLVVYLAITEAYCTHCLDVAPISQEDRDKARLTARAQLLDAAPARPDRN